MKRPFHDSPVAEDVHVVFGIHPVTEAISAGQVLSLLVCSSAPVQLVSLAKKAGIRVENVYQSQLDELSGAGVHQGVVGLVRGYAYQEFDTLLDQALATPPALLVALDRITDPHNLGAIARSAQLLGAHGIVIPFRESAHVTAGAMKASAGALVRLPVARVANLKHALSAARQAGLQLLAADGEGDTELPAADLAGPLLLVIGSEHQGVRPVIRKECDARIRIPMCSSGVGSFNASVAAAICLYEIRRQRLQAGQIVK